MTATVSQTRVGFREMVNQLTRDHEHREPYTAELDSGTTWSAHHTTRVPALIYQLLGAAPAGSGELSGGAARSRPAVRVESLDTVILIDTDAGEWLDRLGEVIPADSIDPDTLLTIRGTGTIRAVRRLGGLHPSISHCQNAKGDQDKKTRQWCCTRHELERDVRHWWHQARIITGWDVPAFKPHNSCPICEARDSLRIRIDAALCVECRSLWEGGDQIGVLARHIHEENDDDS